MKSNLELKNNFLMTDALVKLVFNLFLVSMMVLVSSCFSSKYEFKYGIQEPTASYAPARIAVLGCEVWPESSKVEDIGNINVGPTILNQICNTFDVELLKSFKGQPFVKGKSPKSIKKLLDQSSKPALLDSIFKEWDTPRDCEVCEDPIQYYKHHLSLKNGWTKFTNEFSVATGYSDAILIPIVVNATENHVNERGLIRAKREARVIVLLIDAETASLKWAGTRTASASNSIFVNDIGDRTLLFPDWDIVYQRLFSNILWIDFPGRQEQ